MSEQVIEKKVELERIIKKRSWFLIILAVALSGASALIYEVIAERVLEIFSNGSLYSVTTVLIVFLGGIAIGAGLMTELRKKYQLEAPAFVIIQMVIAIYSSCLLTQFGWLPSIFDRIEEYISSQIAVLLIGGIFYLLIPAILIGSVFPLAAALILERGQADTKRRLGWLYSFDVIGAVVGAALAGFCLIPFLGLVKTLLVAAALNLIASLLLLNYKRITLMYWLLFFAIMSLGVYLFVPYQSNLSLGRDYDRNESYTLRFNENELLYKTSSPYGLVTVREEEWTEGGQNRIMAIGERDQCQSKASESEQRLALSTLSSFKESARVLHIGLGCGFTLQKILEFNPELIDVVEINRVVPSIADQWFGELNGQALDDSRVNLIVDDGAEVVRRGEDKYDVIIIDIENPTIVHSSPLYTLEYFRYAERILKPGGRLALWGYQSQDYRYLKSLVKTLEEVFEHVDFYQDNAYIFVASQGAVDLSEFDLYNTRERLRVEINKLDSIEINTIDNLVLEKYYNP